MRLKRGIIFRRLYYSFLYFMTQLMDRFCVRTSLVKIGKFLLEGIYIMYLGLAN